MGKGLSCASESSQAPIKIKPRSIVYGHVGKGCLKLRSDPLKYSPADLKSHLDLSRHWYLATFRTAFILSCLKLRIVSENRYSQLVRPQYLYLFPSNSLFTSFIGTVFTYRSPSHRYQEP